MQELSAAEQQLYYLVPTGIGLCLIGLLNVVLLRQSVAVRAVLTGGILAAVFAFMASLDTVPEGYAYSAGIFSSGLAMVLVLRSSRSARILAACRKPMPMACTLAVAGLGLAVVPLVLHDRAFEQAIDDEMRDFEILSDVPERRFLEDVYLTTDRGYGVPVSVARDPHDSDELATRERMNEAAQIWTESIIKLHPANENTNCHGWVFTGGRYIVGGDDVERILNDNGYTATDAPEPGDVVVYRDDGHVTHTAFVRYVTPNRPVMVEGKWGWLGVYLHAVDKSAYGTNYTYYRTDRGNDLLKGIASPAIPPVVAATAEKHDVDD